MAAADYLSIVDLLSHVKNPRTLVVTIVLGQLVISSFYTSHLVMIWLTLNLTLGDIKNVLGMEHSRKTPKVATPYHAVEKAPLVLPIISSKVLFQCLMLLHIVNFLLPNIQAKKNLFM